jgi:hypothetical protein
MEFYRKTRKELVGTTTLLWWEIRYKKLALPIADFPKFLTRNWKAFITTPTKDRLRLIPENSLGKFA